MKKHATERIPADEPMLENYPALGEWLTKINAVFLWRADTESSLRTVEAWCANGSVFLIVMFERRHGFDVFTALNSINIDETFADAEHRL